MTKPILVSLFLIFLGHEVVSQSLQSQERSVLLKLKKQWGDLPFMSSWSESNSSDDSHCSWPGITCESNSVTELNFVDIDIRSPVPDFVCDLKNLTVLNVANNYVPGGFPRGLYNCSKLETLDLSDNYFVGQVPDDIDKLGQLRSLVLGGNNFTGDFPAAIGGLKQLRLLNLGANLFNGTLIPEVGDLTNLEVLDLSNNHNLLPSRIPPSFGKLKKLRKFAGFSSNLIGEIPESFGDFEALELFDVSDNGLTGKIPDRLFLLRNLSIAYLFKNSLSGEIPRAVDAPSMTIIDLSENNLIGKIPEGFGNLTKMTGLALFSNNLSGPIPEGIGRLPLLLDISLWDNSLTGVLPQDLGKFSMLRNLQVSSNQLTGKLPEHLCSQGNLIGLVIHDNELTGSLPESLGNCNRLIIVNAKNNKLSGNLPSGLWTSFNLTQLMLSNNAFTGEIPETLASNISRLELSNNRFSGNIPNGLSKCKGLVVFEARNNLLTGTIPAEITTLPGLTNLLLDQNQLTGDLPSEIQSWKSLNTLSLAQNQLTGLIPGGLGNLPALTDLDLSSNRFSGVIPASLGQLRLNFLNLSSNELTGTIPHAIAISAYKDSFSSNPGLCTSVDAVNLRLCGSRPTGRDKITTPYLILIITLSVAVFLLAVSFSFYVVRCYWSKHGLDTKWRLTWFQKLDFTETKVLSGLTDNNLIGSGGSGKVYRVPVNRDGGVVAVKRIVNNRKLEDKLEQEFLAEVKILSSIRHTNIVKLLCCLSSESSKLLVYEYLENRSLDRWLHGKSRQTAGLASRSVHANALEWPKRLQIAVRAAQGLCYMHHDCVPPVIHRDIKSSNILLDADFSPKIADFGLAKMLVKQGELATMSSVAGSFGYMAPEYAHTTRVNEKIDIYSFGVVLLELSTGREANKGGEHTSLAEWAWQHVQEGRAIEAALDKEIMEPCFVEEMSWVFKVGIVCTSTLPSHRPTMKDVVELLLRCSRQAPYGDKSVGFDYDAAPLLNNSKSERVLQDDEDDYV